MVEFKFKPSYSDGDYKQFGMKSLAMFLLGNIILRSQQCFATEGNEGVLSWGAQIKSFDSFISIYYTDDKKYLEQKRRYEKKIEELNPHNPAHKLYYHKVYQNWFSLICQKLARFGIYPPLPVSYAQGIGELNENNTNI